MNRKNIPYYPLILYISLLLVAWLFSWLFGVLHLVDNSSEIKSLMTAEGIRNAVRSSSDIVNAAPWGSAMMFIVSMGMLYSSGLFGLICDIVSFRRITINQRRAGYMSLLILLLYLIVLVMSVISPWRLLMSVTDDVSVSPLARGWLLLLATAVFSVSGIYGYVYGNFRSIMDVMRGIGKSAVFFIPALMAMLPATALLSSLQYMGVFEFFGVSSCFSGYLSDFVYIFPYFFLIPIGKA